MPALTWPARGPRDCNTIVVVGSSRQHSQPGIPRSSSACRGHMDLDPGRHPGIARRRSRPSCSELKEHLPETEIQIIVGMAAGADLLVAQTALDMGVRVEAVLPMPLEHYAADFDARHLAPAQEPAGAARRSLHGIAPAAASGQGRARRRCRAPRRDVRQPDRDADPAQQPAAGAVGRTVLAAARAAPPTPCCAFWASRTDANMAADSIVLVDSDEDTRQHRAAGVLDTRGAQQRHAGRHRTPPLLPALRRRQHPAHAARHARVAGVPAQRAEPLQPRVPRAGGLRAAWPPTIRCWRRCRRTPRCTRR